MDASETITLTAGSAITRVDLADGGRLSSLSVDGLELLGRSGDRRIDYGSFVMAPWAGRLRDGLLTVGDRTHRLPTDVAPPHAIHGTVHDRPWELLEADRGTLKVRCGFDDRWPFGGWVDHDVTLSEDSLTERLQVHADRAAFVASAGWHPWFRRRLDAGGDARITMDARAMLQRDDTGLPTGSEVPVPPEPWDDCFVGVRWPVAITWPSALTLSIDADTDLAVVFTERPDALCVEPQIGPPDGLNSDPYEVRPGHPLVASTTWAWEAG
jgi:aldose 1-epimerase